MLRHILFVSASALFLNLTCLAPTVEAATLQIKAEFTMSGENTREIESDELDSSGWTVAEVADETVHSLSVTIDSSQLPYRTAIGDGYLRISKTGLITIGLSVGDDDAGTEASLQWPLMKKKLVPMTHPMILTANGGENASGAWSFNGQATIVVSE